MYKNHMVVKMSIYKYFIKKEYLIIPIREYLFWLWFLIDKIAAYYLAHSLLEKYPVRPLNLKYAGQVMWPAGQTEEKRMENQAMDPLLDFSGRVAVISGGASGIGYGTAQLFAMRNAVSVIVDIDEDKGKKAAARITDMGGKAEFVRCDVTSEKDCCSCIESIVKWHGRIDILFNNAGIIRRKTIAELDETDWNIVIDVTLKGAFLLSKYAIPVMAENGGGSIINTGSGWGLKGGNKAAAYCAAKGGIVNMTRAMAIDHGPQGIRVNSISPGDIDTPLLHDEARQLGCDDNDFMAEAADRPLARVGTPMDIAKAALFLAGPMSEWITGANLTVDGGGLA